MHVRKSDNPPHLTSTESTNIKKGKMEQEMADNIVKEIKLAISKQGSSLEKSTDDLKRSVQFPSADLQNIKETLKTTVKRVDTAEKKIKILENQVVELAQYKSRWNLRLKGLQKAEG